MKILLSIATLVAIAAAAATDDSPTNPSSTTVESSPAPTWSTTEGTTTEASTTTTTTTPAWTTTTTFAPTTTTTPASTTTSTTPKYSTTTASPDVTTTSKPTTPAPPTPQEDPTEGNYTVNTGDDVCAYVIMKVVVTQNSTRVPFVNASVVEADSRCSNDSIHLLIRTPEDNELQLVFAQDKSDFYIQQITVRVKPNIVADRTNLTQFSTPFDRFYKCTQASEVLLENDVKVIFSDMQYQAFKKTKKAEFTGTELKCAADAHSDVVIIAIGCALAVLVVVILIAYLIARRTHRQRGYQSV